MSRLLNVALTAFFLLSLNCTTITAQTQRVVSPDDRTMALARMKHWREALAKDADLLKKTFGLDTTYIDIWATLDLDEGIRCTSQWPRSTALFHRLAYAERWEDITRLSTECNRNWMMKFWSDVANHAVSQEDLSLVECAGKQVEANGIFEESAPGGPPRPSRSLISARFFVATARLELLRKTDAREIVQLRAAEDLTRTAASFPVGRSSHEVFQGVIPFAALESWVWGGSDRAKPGLHSDQALDSIQRHYEREISWPSGIRLPALDSMVTDAWLQRKVFLKSDSVVLNYLLRADGEAADRARLFAIAARGMADRNPDQAKQFVSTAEALLEAKAEATWPRVEALAELSLSLHRLGRNKEASAALGRSVRYTNELETKFASNERRERSVASTPNDVVLNAASELGWIREALPEHVFGEYLDRHKVPPSLHIRGVKRFADLTKLVQVREPKRWPTHKRYFELEAERNWPAALSEAEVNATRNPAWKRHYAKLGASHFRDHGLKETLDWTETIEAEVTRLSVELGAIKAALEPERRTLPARNPSSIHSIAPAISWPTGC